MADINSDFSNITHGFIHLAYLYYSHLLSTNVDISNVMGT